MGLWRPQPGLEIWAEVSLARSPVWLGEAVVGNHRHCAQSIYSVSSVGGSPVCAYLKHAHSILMEKDDFTPVYICEETEAQNIN